MQCAKIYKITCGEKLFTNGKVRILIRTEIHILHVWTSADPHVRILPPVVAVHASTSLLTSIAFRRLVVIVASTIRNRHENVLQLCWQWRTLEKWHEHACITHVRVCSSISDSMTSGGGYTLFLVVCTMWIICGVQSGLHICIHH